MNATARLVDDLFSVRRAQDREIAELDQVQGRAPTVAEQREIAALSARYRELFNDLELSLPQVRADDNPLRYRLRILAPLQRHSPTWRGHDLTRVAGVAGALQPIEAEITADARRIATDKTIGSFRRPGHLREVRRVDQAGHEVLEFAGSPLSWMREWMPPVETRVEAFVDPRTGRPLRLGWM